MSPWMGPGATIALRMDQIVVPRTKTTAASCAEHGHLRARLDLNTPDVSQREICVDARIRSAGLTPRRDACRETR